MTGDISKIKTQNLVNVRDIQVKIQAALGKQMVACIDELQRFDKRFARIVESSGNDELLTMRHELLNSINNFDESRRRVDKNVATITEELLARGVATFDR